VVATVEESNKAIRKAAGPMALMGQGLRLPLGDLEEGRVRRN
jgi:hypothetical protein